MPLVLETKLLLSSGEGIYLAVVFAGVYRLINRLLNAHFGIEV